MKCFENEDYLRCKVRLEEIYEIKANGVKIRNKCDWYEYGEKSSKFFLNLEKNSFVWGQIYDIGKKINNKMKSIIIFSHFTKIFFLTN